MLHVKNHFARLVKTQCIIHLRNMVSLGARPSQGDLCHLHDCIYILEKMIDKSFLAIKETTKQQTLTHSVFP